MMMGRPIENVLGALQPQDISAPNYGSEVSGQFHTGAEVSYGQFVTGERKEFLVTRFLRDPYDDDDE